MESSHVTPVLRHRIPGPLRFTGALVANWFIAVAGGGIAEEEFRNFYHPHTYSGLYSREIILIAIVPLCLGGLVYYRWRLAAAKWVGIFGACYFAWRIVVPSFPNDGFDWNPVFSDYVKAAYG